MVSPYSWPLKLPFPAAHTIQIPVFAAFFSAVSYMLRISLSLYSPKLILITSEPSLTASSKAARTYDGLVYILPLTSRPSATFIRTSCESYAMPLYSSAPSLPLLPAAYAATAVPCSSSVLTVFVLSPA